jgi:uncharacterized membrane protein YhaH (DUF805 family)
MRQYFSPHGTATRSEYWAVQIIGFLTFAAVVLLGVLFVVAQLFVMAGVTYFVAFVGYIWLLITTSIRRCDNAGISAWWTLATVLPYIGLIVWIVIGCLTPDARYASTPKSES